jgi:hypothetical protein
MITPGNSEAENECKWVLVIGVISEAATGQKKMNCAYSLPLNVTKMILAVDDYFKGYMVVAEKYARLV